MLGLERTRLADLNGDGLTDLWGDLDGELRRFAVRHPRLGALGQFGPAAAFDSRVSLTGNAGVDFDGDGVADSLIGGLAAPSAQARVVGSHTAIARSGRDGHAIWKTGVFPRESWLDPNNSNSYELSAFPLPAGDFDGDGTADVIVRKKASGWGIAVEPGVRRLSRCSRAARGLGCGR